MASQNPFFIGGPVPPEHFVGRKSEIDAAFDQILNRSHLAIWGSPGMGKSSFLNFLTASQAWRERRLSFFETVIVYLNCTNINPFTPFAFWREVWKGFENSPMGILRFFKMRVIFCTTLCVLGKRLSSRPSLRISQVPLNSTSEMPGHSPLRWSRWF